MRLQALLLAAVAIVGISWLHGLDLGLAWFSLPEETS
jgi:hypothetical protein